MLFSTSPKRTIRMLLRRLNLLLALPLALTISLDAAFAAGAKQKNNQQIFSSPQDAARALATAARNNDAAQLIAILGLEGKDLIFSGDEVSDKASLDRFARAYEEKNQLIPMDGPRMILEVGNDEWPLPIPIVKAADKGWLFDTRSGKEEILNRRIGRNELNTIQVCLAYVSAQREYASRYRNGDGVLEYAQKFGSDPGKKNGLYWEAKDGGEQSPFGPLFAKSLREGYSTRSADEPAPYHGYYFKILKSQGREAPRGAYQYVMNGKMIGGFAMVAYPAEYGVSGIMTFIVSHDGVVYEKNLGRNTKSIARAMTSFNPDSTWQKLTDQELRGPDREDED